jgi:hypothetical protein
VRRRTKGKRPLASATSIEGVIVSGTRDALLIGDLRIPWEQIESADWDLDSSLLRVAEVGTWGEQRPVHELGLTDPGRLLELIRERITASIVLQRHVPVRGRAGVFVIARRPPRGDAPIQWIYEYQEGIDPADPDVRRAAEAALAAARDEVGLS